MQQQILILCDGYWLKTDAEQQQTEKN